MKNDINPPVPFIAQGLVCNWGEIYQWAMLNSPLFREAIEHASPMNLSTLEAVRYACALLLLQEHGLIALLAKATVKPLTAEEKALVNLSWGEYVAIRNRGTEEPITRGLSVEFMRNALLANGWTPGSSGTVWKSPTGQRFLGPVQAYKIMCGVFASDHCNVCGCALQGDSEHAMGMCTAHANEGAGL